MCCHIVGYCYAINKIFAFGKLLRKDFIFFERTINKISSNIKTMGLSGLQNIISKGGKFINRLKNYYNIAKDIYDKGKTIYNTGKNIYDSVQKIKNLKNEQILPVNKKLMTE